MYLLGRLHFPIAVQEVALDDGAHDGQTLSRLQLRGEGEKTRVFHIEVLVELQQHEQLRPVESKRVKRIQKVRIEGLRPKY